MDDKIDTRPLEHFLMFHKVTCTVHVWSGDRKCSCGRDKALEVFNDLKKLAENNQPRQMNLMDVGQSTE